MWNSAALNGQRGSDGGGGGSCVFGRGQLQERTHRPGQLGEPSLLQDVEGQAQLGLRPDKEHMHTHTRTETHARQKEDGKQERGEQKRICQWMCK